MVNAVYGQSGGPTSVINASFYGVVDQCKIEKGIDNLFIMHNGIKGLIDDDLKIIGDIDKDQLELLPYTPGAICGSVRYKLKKHTEDASDYNKILEVLKKHDIHYIFLNGGNDSMDTLLKLKEFFVTVDYDVKLVGIPKTIDNDLVLTDHTPGFGSAAKFTINAIQSISYDNDTYAKGRVNIVEIMGRDAGWLTASSSLANISGHGPDLIYVPEVPFSKTKFLEDVKRIYSEKSRCLVAVSEGIRDKAGDFIAASNKDAFNHVQLGGVGMVLASWINSELKLPTRAIELSLLQRCYAPALSQIDGKEALKCGKAAVRKALEGASGVMISMERNPEEDYKIIYNTVPLEKVANAVKFLPKEYINAEGNNINPSFISYCYPLIGGRGELPITNGINNYADPKKFF